MHYFPPDHEFQKVRKEKNALKATLNDVKDERDRLVAESKKSFVQKTSDFFSHIGGSCPRRRNGNTGDPAGSPFGERRLSLPTSNFHDMREGL
jgi:hypothetical protein